MRTELCCWFKAFKWLENSICCPHVDQVLRSAKAFFYQQMILSWFKHFIELGREQESTPFRWAELLGEVWKWLDVSLPKQRRTSPHFWRCTPWNTWRWGESRNPLRIDQWFCMLEGWSEKNIAILLIQSVQLTWKLNLSPTCQSGTHFCRGFLLSTNDFGVVWMFLWVEERAGIYSVLTNDFVC
jgi:hypothetical protein